MLLQALRTVLKAIALLGSLIQVSAYFHVTPAHLPVGRQVHSSPRVYFASRKCFLQRGRISRRCVNLLFLSPPLFSSLFLSLFPSLSLSFPKSFTNCDAVVLCRRIGTRGEVSLMGAR